MPDTPSIRIRTYDTTVIFGILSVVCLIWAVVSPAGWPFFERESATWQKILVARLLPSLLAVYFGYLAVDAVYFRLDADHTGIHYRRGRSHTPVITVWDQVKSWQIARGGSQETESERGAKSQTYGKDWAHIHFQLFDGREWYLTFSLIDPPKREEFIAVLRTFIGDCEFPEYTIRR